MFFFFSSRRRHTRYWRDWSSDVCSSDLNIAGRLYGLPNVCPHQTGPLCEGKTTTGTLVARKENDWRFEWAYEGEIVACPWHGLECHIPTGRCLAFPNINLRRYEVVVEDGKVKVRV